MPKCVATTATGKSCNSNAMLGCDLCSSHKRQQERQASMSHENEHSTRSESEARTWLSEVEEVEENMMATINIEKPQPPSPVSQGSMSTHTTNSSVTTQSFNLLIERLESIERKLQNVGNASTKQSSASKVRKMTEKSALVSAKWIFYQDSKTDESIITSVRNGLVQGNMLVKKTKVVNGETIEVDNIPWQLIKIATDLMFASSSNDVKEKYINMAWMKYATKRASQCDA